MKPIIIIGAGIGGLSAAIKLAKQGHKVHIIEARPQSGGLASGLSYDGFSFDAGPYILLDKPGLDWAFNQLGIPESSLPLIPIESVYTVLDEAGINTSFYKDLNRTAASFEQQYPGSSTLYTNFVRQTFATHQSLKSLTFKSHPGPIDLLKNGLLSKAPFLLSSLYRVLKQAHLPDTISRAISIWTHIAGQDTKEAPSAMAFVPGFFHNIGSYYPKGGMRAIAELLINTAEESGVIFTYGQKVSAILTEGKSVSGIKLENGQSIDTNYIISNSSGIGTYTELAHVSQQKKEELEKLPLQSPGMCIYLSVKGKNPPHYIRFLLKGKSCIAFVQPALMDDSIGKDGWYPARLIAPLDHDTAAALGEKGQQDLMDELVKESWWQTAIEEYKVLHKRTTYEWGREYNLYRDSMNPVMTAKFMLKGRMAHRSPYLKGLYLAGSSTHPGQWVSFCAISGVLAANELIKDASGHA